MPLPILYSFRRCPYAMRARVAITLSGLDVEIREVVLKNKPPALLLVSPKATVPVLVLSNGTVIEQSTEIMEWALKTNNQLMPISVSESALISRNDQQFKPQLDRYKYFERYPDSTQDDYRAQGEVFLSELEQLLLNNHQLTSTNYSTFLFGHQASFADIAIFPFIRQFAHVDKQWFAQAPYPKLIAWLEHLLTTVEFITAMHKYPQWQEYDPVSHFPPRNK